MKLEFYLNVGSKYLYVPPRQVMPHKTLFINTPGEYYDPLRGERLIDDFIDTLTYGERLGFDGIFVLEQHGGPTAVAGQSIVLATWLAARTQRIRIGTVGAIINGYLTPIRLAEEVATIDLLSGGRYFFGLPMGIGMNYHAYGMMNPAFARERYREAHDLLIRAFTQPGPFEWNGKFFHARYVNLWPRPLQSPHPPIWIPAAGSRESLELCARNHYTYLAVLNPWKVLVRNCETFRELCQEAGYEYDPRQIAANFNIHVAESDAQARREAEPYVMWLYQNGLGSPFHDSFPPGHVSERSLRGMAAGGGYRSRDISQMRWEELVDEGWVIAGSPATVADRLEQLVGELGAGRVVVCADAFSMPPWLVRKSMTLFAEQVIPRFRDEDGKPIWAKQEAPGLSSISEFGARVSDPKAIPSARVNGQPVDLRTAHIEELREPVTPVPTTS